MMTLLNDWSSIRNDINME